MGQAGAATALASASTSLLALQSAALRLVPSPFLTSPMASWDVCEGSPTSLPVVKMTDISSPTMCAILFQTLARALEWWVALVVPAAAAVISAWQSVRIACGKGQCSTNLKRPSFGRGGGGTPRWWPAKGVSQQVAIGSDNRDAETRRREDLPLAIQKRAVAIPGRCCQCQGLRVLSQGLASHWNEPHSTTPPTASAESCPPTQNAFEIPAVAKRATCQGPTVANAKIRFAIYGFPCLQRLRRYNQPGTLLRTKRQRLEIYSFPNAQGHRCHSIPEKCVEIRTPSPAFFFIANLNQ